MQNSVFFLPQKQHRSNKIGDLSQNHDMKQTLHPSKKLHQTLDEEMICSGGQRGRRIRDEGILCRWGRRRDPNNTRRRNNKGTTYTAICQPLYGLPTGEMQLCFETARCSCVGSEATVRWAVAGGTVAVSLAAELGEGEVVLWDDLASLMLRLPEAEAKEWAKRVAVISENKTAKQERKWRHGRTDGVDRMMCSLGTLERERREIWGVKK
jgi:hypothetical protein